MTIFAKIKLYKYFPNYNTQFYNFFYNKPVIFFKINITGKSFRSLQILSIPGLSSPYCTTSMISLPFKNALLILSSVTSDQNTYPFSRWKSKAMAFSSPCRMESYSVLSGNTLRMSTRLAKIKYGFPPEKILMKY